MNQRPDSKFIPRNPSPWLPWVGGLVLAVSQAPGQTVAWGTSVSFNPLSFTSHGTVDDGILTWELGWFTAPPDPTDWAQWLTNWRAVAQSTHRDWGGIWAVSVNTYDVGSLAAGKQAYLFAYNDKAKLGTPAGEALLVRQNGLLLPSIPNQVTFDLADNPLDDGMSINDDSFTVIWGRVDRRMYDPGGIVAGGGVISNPVADSTARPADQLNGTFEAQSATWIPEPSAALLGGLGVLSLLRRRR